MGPGPFCIRSVRQQRINNVNNDSHRYAFYDAATEIAGPAYTVKAEAQVIRRQSTTGGATVQYYPPDPDPPGDAGRWGYSHDGFAYWDSGVTGTGDSFEVVAVIEMVR